MRAALLQPYLPGVDIDGERAVVFFGGEISHVLHKRPVLRDPGVAPRRSDCPQPRRRSCSSPIWSFPAAPAPSSWSWLGASTPRSSARFGQPLFARVDMVPGPDGSPVLIELEAIEPMLYLDLIPGAAERFAAQRVGQRLDA